MITRKDIEEIFGHHLSKIQEAELKERVVSCWVYACEKGGWTKVEDLWKMPFTLLTNAHGISFLEHTMAVAEGALGLAEAQIKFYKKYEKLPYRINLDWVIAGAILHDVGKLLEIEPDQKGGYKKSRSGMCLRHPIYGIALASQFGFPEELLNAIACHAKEGEGSPKTIETVLIHQADFATFTPLVMMSKGDLIQ